MKMSHKQMDKHALVYSSNGIIFNNKKGTNMPKYGCTSKNYDDKLDTREFISYDSI